MKNYHERRGAMSNITIESLGGDGGIVTGSCHKLRIKNSSMTVDYGMFQGRKEEKSSRGERRNFTPTRDIASGVSDVMLTHLHIDHSGLLPNMFKAGFTPRILTTEITAHFLETMLKNSAKIQSEENKENQLYDSRDVDKTLRSVKVVKPFTEIPVGQKHSRITAEFLPNGHVMGAASVLIRSREEGKKKNILFTGDMGKPHQSLCGGYMEQEAEYPDDSINTLVVESTNFLKEPISFEEKKMALFNEIKETWKRGGNVLMPVLSFHRLQELIEMFNNSRKELDSSDNFEIVIDAPLGMELLEGFKKLKPNQLTKYYGDDPNFYKTDEESLARFELANFKIIQSHEDSVAADQMYGSDYRRKVIIIPSGGMAEAGRSLNYIRGYFGKNPLNSVVFTCFQVNETKGASLVRNGSIPKGEKNGARVIKIDGFASHISGPTETFDFLERFDLRNLDTVIITHGKDVARAAMANVFRSNGYDKARIILPKLNQKIVI